MLKEIAALGLLRGGVSVGVFEKGCDGGGGGGVSMGNIIVKNGFIKKGSLNDFDIYSSLIRMISVI